MEQLSVHEQWQSESDPAKLRAALLQDPYNVPLRKHYLSRRTPELLGEDQGTVRSHLDALKKLVPGLGYGVVIGLIVWAISWAVVELGWQADENPATRGEKLMGILQMFANRLGLVVSIIAFSLTTGLFAWSQGLEALKRGRIAVEVGPLPENAPDNVAKAREVLLRS